MLKFQCTPKESSIKLKRIENRILARYLYTHVHTLLQPKERSNPSAHRKLNGSARCGMQFDEILRSFKDEHPVLVFGRGLPAQVQHSEFQASRGFKTKTKIKKTKTNNRLKKKKQELYQENPTKLFAAG